MEKAAEWLRKKDHRGQQLGGSGVALRPKVRCVVHPHTAADRRPSEVNCQTDFVARTDDFRTSAKTFTMHIAGRDPFPGTFRMTRFPAVVERERASRQKRAKKRASKQTSSPRSSMALSASGRRHLPATKSSSRTRSKDIRTLALELSAKTGEKITIRRFTRYALGDGLQKKRAGLRFRKSRLRLPSVPPRPPNSPHPTSPAFQTRFISASSSNCRARR